MKHCYALSVASENGCTQTVATPLSLFVYLEINFNG